MSATVVNPLSSVPSHRGRGQCHPCRASPPHPELCRPGSALARCGQCGSALSGPGSVAQHVGA